MGQNIFATHWIHTSTVWVRLHSFSYFRAMNRLKTVLLYGGIEINWHCKNLSVNAHTHTEVFMSQTQDFKGLCWFVVRGLAR